MMSRINSQRFHGITLFRKGFYSTYMLMFHSLHTLLTIAELRHESKIFKDCVKILIEGNKEQREKLLKKVIIDRKKGVR